MATRVGGKITENRMLTESMILQNYEFYFSSGHYDRRYPAPNATVLRLIQRHLPKNGHVIDFGCGSGRYLLALRDQARVAAGFDKCQAALAKLRERAKGSGHIQLLGPDPQDLDRHVDQHGPADIILCLFGVLAHMEGRAVRTQALRRLAGFLKTGSGRIILSVPNRNRRFLCEQKAQDSYGHNKISYTREFDKGTVRLSYKLFDTETLRAELTEAGLELETIKAESLAPESVVARSTILRAFDKMAASLIPAAWGYGLLAVARPLPNITEEENSSGSGR